LAIDKIDVRSMGMVKVAPILGARGVNVLDIVAPVLPSVSRPQVSPFDVALSKISTTTAAAISKSTTESVSVNKQTGVKPGSLGVKFDPVPGVGLRIKSLVPDGSAALSVS
jgi:hypothetical protein